MKDLKEESTVVEEVEEEVEVGPAGTGAVVDMEVFGQLLEIVRSSLQRFTETSLV